MTLLLIPISLLGILLITTLLYGIAGIAAPAPYNLYSQQPLSPIAGFYLAEWTSSSDFSKPESIATTSKQPAHPIRVKLHWRSNSMSAISDSTPLVTSDDAGLKARALKRFSVQIPLTSELKENARKSIAESPTYVSPKETLQKQEPGNFLVALAAQERRVLELKEELQKAEIDLAKLKRQWAHHEATRKRQEIRQQAEPMRPLKSPVKDLSMVRELEGAVEPSNKRPAAVRTRHTQRKIFEGGRHTRALSLLSPTSLVNRGSVTEGIEPNIRRSTIEAGPMTAIPKVSTVQASRADSQPSKEDIVATGKQIMGDIKEGLWTFIEDLRQATVGDEALSPARSRLIDTTPGLAEPNVSQGPAGSLHTMDAVLPKRRKSPSPKATNDTTVQKAKESEAPRGEQSTSVANFKDTSDDEGWANWDSPPSKSSVSTISSPAQSTPRSSLSLDTKRHSAAFDQIPWPVLQKLPSNLTRTASNLMKEWENSLKSPSEETNESQLLDAGRKGPST